MRFYLNHFFVRLSKGYKTFLKRNEIYLNHFFVRLSKGYKTFLNRNEILFKPLLC